jgi:hypothetical protein
MKNARSIYKYLYYVYSISQRSRLAQKNEPVFPEERVRSAT